MFIIKYHYEATEANTNRSGNVHDWYTGRGGSHIGIYGEKPTEWEIANYGYKTLATAKRALRSAQEMADWETKQGFWNVTAELITI